MNILTVSTYPPEPPRHGGQHRIDNIIRALRAAGHTVQSAGVLGNPIYRASPGFVECPPQGVFRKYISNSMFMEDWCIGKLFSDDQRYFNHLSSRITIKPDLIFCEQPWMYSFSNKFNREICSGSAKIVYGSQNVEHRLKQSILAPYKSKAELDVAVDLIRRCELEAISGAEFVVCVSESDLSWIGTQTTAPIILAQNGVPERVADLEGVREANRVTGHRKFALYCASAHPPNMEGFFHFFGTGLGAFGPWDRLVVAGGAGASIRSDRRFDGVAMLNGVYVDAGFVTEPCLSGLLETSHVTIAPIRDGEGTNLKTAEALWAGHHVVASTAAMRGFEQFTGAEGVAIADDPADFRQAIRMAMAAPPLTLSDSERLRRRSVLWDHTLRQLVEFVNRWRRGRQ